MLCVCSGEKTVKKIIASFPALPKKMISRFQIIKLLIRRLTWNSSRNEILPKMAAKTVSFVAQFFVSFSIACDKDKVVHCPQTRSFFTSSTLDKLWFVIAPTKSLLQLTFHESALKLSLLNERFRPQSNLNSEKKRPNFTWLAACNEREYSLENEIDTTKVFRTDFTRNSFTSLPLNGCVLVSVHFIGAEIFKSKYEIWNLHLFHLVMFDYDI